MTRKNKNILIKILLYILMFIQISYVAFFEGFILWISQQLTTVGYDHKYLTLVLICFIPNYIYTYTKARPVIKYLTTEDDEDAS